MTFPRGVLLLSACVFAFFGAWAAMFPAGQVGLIDVGVPNATARADIRAQYGGFMLGMAAFLLACFARREWVPVGLLASAFALTGFSLVRGLSALLDGPVSPTIYYLLCGEASGAILSFVGWRTTLPR